MPDGFNNNIEHAWKNVLNIKSTLIIILIILLCFVSDHGAVFFSSATQKIFKNPQRQCSLY